MLPKERRLKREREFEQVFKKGTSVYDTACGVRFKKNTLGISRFAVVVGTKVHKRAVKRNKVRRQYQEILRSFMEDLQEGFDVILLTNKEALTLNYEEKATRLRKVLKKANLLKV